MSGNPAPGPRRRGRGPTLRDVARHADVSVWTVSNTFSNPDRVAPATRQRVLTSAHALGYAGPDPLARSLALGRARVLALAAAGPVESLLADPAAALVARGLVRACDRAGLSLLLTSDLGGSGVDGGALFRASPPAAAHHPVVTIDAPGAGAPEVAADVRGAGALAAAHLRGLGHEDLAVLTWAGAGERLDGVRDGWGGGRGARVLQARGTEVGAHAESSRQADGESLARAALAADPRPTAVLALSDVLARAALDVAGWMGLAVPGDVSIVGLDDLPGNDALGLTSALIPYGPMGELAGDLLVGLMEGAEPVSAPVLPTTLAVRASSGPRRARR